MASGRPGREALDRLVVRDACTASWDEMQGEGPKRFCEQCQKSVFDFAAMTPYAIRRRLEAGRGQVCARLTRRDGHLVVLEPEEPIEPPSSWSERRASPIAATLVTALLGMGGVGGATAQASPTSAMTRAAASSSALEPASAALSEEATHGASAIFQGHVNDQDGLPLPAVEVIARNVLDGQEQRAVTLADGAFWFAGLSAGVYDLAAHLDGFSVAQISEITLGPGEVKVAEITLTDRFEETITVGGVLAIEVLPLRKLFEASDLVVAATAGPSVVLSRGDGLTEVGTELRVESVIHGSFDARTLIYRHAESVDSEQALAQALTVVPLGAKVLAFLDLASGQEGPLGGDLFDSVDASRGVRVLETTDRETYLDHLDRLVQLKRQSATGVLDPESLIEWLVSLAEDSVTRDDGIGELWTARDELKQRAELVGRSADDLAFELRGSVEMFRAEGRVVRTDVSRAVLGAFLTEPQKRRLTATLRRSERPLFDDYALFDLVRGWDPAEARSWATSRLRGSKLMDDDGDLLGQLTMLARDLGLHEADELAQAAWQRSEEVDDLWPDDESDAAEQRRGLKRAEVAEHFRDEILQRLAGAR